MQPNCTIFVDHIDDAVTHNRWPIDPVPEEDLEKFFLYGFLDIVSRDTYTGTVMTIRYKRNVRRRVKSRKRGSRK